MVDITWAEVEGDDGGGVIMRAVVTNDGDWFGDEDVGWREEEGVAHEELVPGKVDLQLVNPQRLEHLEG